MEFPILKDGKYEFACDYGPDSKGPEVVLAVGSGVGESIFLTIAECFASMIGGFGACMCVVIFVLINRAKQTKEMQQTIQAENTPPPLNT